MANRNLYDDIYGIGAQTSAIGTAVACSKGIPLLGHPDFNPGVNVVKQRKATGLPYWRGDAGYEFQNTTEVPNTSFEFDGSATNMSLILWSFFQGGAFQDAGANNIKYFVPYSDSACDVWLTLVRKLAASGTGASHRLVGMVAKSITLSCSESAPVLKVSVEFVGYNLETNHNIASDTLTFDATVPYLWQNATITLDGNAVNIPGFSLTMTNNAVVKLYDNANASKVLMGNFEANGTFQMPYSDANEGANNQINDFIAGTTKRMNIRWGSNEIAKDASDFSILMNIRSSAAPFGGDDEIVADVAFDCVSDASTSSVKAANSSVQLNGTAAVAGTNTTFADSLDVGDLLYVINSTSAGDESVRCLVAIASNTAATVYPDYAASVASLKYKGTSTPLTISIRDGVSVAGM